MQRAVTSERTIDSRTDTGRRIIEHTCSGDVITWVDHPNMVSDNLHRSAGLAEQTPDSTRVTLVGQERCYIGLLKVA